MSNTDDIQRDFLDAGRMDGLGRFDAIVTMQAVHELRHERRAPKLHGQARTLLEAGRLNLVCDHVPSQGGIADSDLFMTADAEAPLA